MKNFNSINDVYSPWRDTESASEEILPRDSSTAPEDQDCRSYTLHVVRERLTEVELKLKGLLGIEVTYTAPRSIFHRHIL